MGRWNGVAMKVWTRRALVAMPVVVTLGVAAVVGVLVVTQNQRQTDSVAAADVVAEDYLSKVAAFRTDAAKKIKAAHREDPATLKRVVDKAVSTPPRLPDVSGFGKEHSTAFREATEVSKSLLDPYRRLSATLDDAEPALNFVSAARKLLALRATDYVGFDLISSSQQVRSKLIPPFVNARNVFDAIDVPKGQEELAAKVHDAVQYVINQATALAEHIDARKSFSFGYSEQFQDALDAVNDYATKVAGDVTEATNAVIVVN